MEKTGTDVALYVHFVIQIVSAVPRPLRKGLKEAQPVASSPGELKSSL